MRQDMDSVRRVLEAAVREPEPDDWTAAYTPEQLEEYRPELEALEAELDEGWPGWRDKAPFHEQPSAKIAWIKVRLKRRDLIVRGKATWGVRVVDIDGEPFAVSVKPARVRGDSDAYAPAYSVPLLARRLGVRGAKIRPHLAELPDGVRDVEGWLRDRLAAAESGDPGSAPSTAPASVAAPAAEKKKTTRKRKKQDADAGAGEA